MIQVFCNRRGSGKTKALIEMANNEVNHCKGNVVYIHNNTRPMLQLDRRIRFVATDEFNLKDYNTFYGFLCGMLSENYDIQAIYIDSLSNIICSEIDAAANLFSSLEKFSQNYNIQFFINISHECDEIPEFIKKYGA